MNGWWSSSDAYLNLLWSQDFSPLNYKYDDLHNTFYNVKSIIPEMNPAWSLLAPVCWYFTQDSCPIRSVTFLPTKCPCLLLESITNCIRLTTWVKSVLSFFIFWNGLCKLETVFLNGIGETTYKNIWNWYLFCGKIFSYWLKFFKNYRILQVFITS